MADKQKGKVEEVVTDPNAEKKEKKSQKLGFFGTLFAVAFVVAVMVGIGAGVFVYVFKNNVGGAADRNRAALQQIPILKYALPAPKDPDATELFSDKELRVKYNEILKDRNQLRSLIEEANKKLGETDKIKLEVGQVKAESATVKAQSDATKADIEKEKAALAEEKKKFDEIVAKADKQALAAFFEKVNPDTAKKVYEEVMQQKKADNGALEFAKIYETMDPSASAKILQEMGSANMDQVVSILRNVKKATSAEILAAMDAKFAASLSDKLQKAYIQ